MAEADLKEEFNKLSIHLKEVFEANGDYRAGILAETTKEEEEEPLLGEQQEADRKNSKSCGVKILKSKGHCAIQPVVTVGHSGTERTVGEIRKSGPI